MEGKARMEIRKKLIVVFRGADGGETEGTVTMRSYRMQWRGVHPITERERDSVIDDAQEKFGHPVYVWEDTDRSGAPVTLTRVDARESGHSLELLVTYH